MILSKPRVKEIQEFLAQISESSEASEDQKAIAKSHANYLGKATAPIKPRSAKNKGKGFQNLVCSMLGDALGIEWGTTEDFLIQSRPMGQHGVDIILLGEARQKFPFSVECKAAENVSLPAVVDQAKSNVKPGDHWLIAIKNSKFKEPIAVLDLQTFIEIVASKAAKE